MSDSNQRPTAELVLHEGTDAPRRIPLYQKDIVIGRGCNCDVTLQSLQISRRHATLEYLNRKWFVRDASTNGLSVGSERLTKGMLKELKQNDLLHLIPTGSLIYRFEYKNEAHKTERVVPPTVTLEDASDDDEVQEPEIVAVDDNSNLSESLLSVNDGDADAVILDELLDLNPPPAEPSTSAPEFSNAPLGKRKPITKTELESELEDGQADKKRKRSYSEDEKLFREPINSQSDDSSDDLFQSLRAVSDNSMDFINPIPLGEPPGGSGSGSASSNYVEMTPQEIQYCDDVHTLQNQCMVFYQKFKLAEANSQTLKMEKRMEREDYLKKISEAESKSEVIREELYKQILEALEHEFSCCICNEVFVQPTVADCGHTFCGFCIEEWTRKKPECPICRKLIRNPTKHIEIDNFLVKIHTMMSEEIKTKRDIQIAERITQKEKAAVRAQQESRGRRNGVPNADFGMLFGNGIPFDLVAEMHNINNLDNQGWPNPPNAHNNNAATTASDRRRSARIQASRPTGPASRAASRRGPRHGPHVPLPRPLAEDYRDLFQGFGPAARNILDDANIVALDLPGVPRHMAGAGGPPAVNNNEPQPGTSRGGGGGGVGNPIYFSTAGGVPPFRLAPSSTRESFFPYFGFGGMGRSDNLEPPPRVVPTTSAPPNTNSARPDLVDIHLE